jgi:hypothetical protein
LVTLTQDPHHLINGVSWNLKIGVVADQRWFREKHEANLRAVAERIKAMGFASQIGDYVDAGKNLIQYSNMVTI